MTPDPAALMAAARKAAGLAYAPYSRFRVGAALALADGTVLTAGNVENASYGLSLCAETVAAAMAMQGGLRSPLVAVAVASPDAREGPLAPCGRCRQVLHELAALGGTDPLILGDGGDCVLEAPLSSLLPHAFGPDALGPSAQGTERISP